MGVLISRHLAHALTMLISDNMTWRRHLAARLINLDMKNILHPEKPYWRAMALHVVCSPHAKSSDKHGQLIYMIEPSA